MKTFREITVGGIDKNSLIQRMTNAGIQFNKYVPNLFENPSFWPDSPIEKVVMVKLKFADLNLNLNHICSYQKIIHQA